MQTEEIEIRPMSEKHLNAILVIYRESFGSYRGLERLIRGIKNKTCSAIVACTAVGEVVGFLFYEEQKRGFHLESIVVDEAFRQRGIGRMLIDDLKHKLPGEKSLRIRADVGTNNWIGREFFTKMQFVGKRIRLHASEFHAHVFEFVADSSMAALKVIPIHAFLDENNSPEERLLSELHVTLIKADVIIVRDVMSQAETPLLGGELLRENRETNDRHKLTTVVIELDTESDELPSLARIIDML